MAAISWLFLTIGILLGLTTLTGILANVSVLLVVYWNRSLQTQINMLLVSLAVADLGVAASCVPFAITTVFLQSNVSIEENFALKNRYRVIVKWPNKHSFRTHFNIHQRHNHLHQLGGGGAKRNENGTSKVRQSFGTRNHILNISVAHHILRKVPFYVENILPNI